MITTRADAHREIFRVIKEANDNAPPGYGIPQIVYPGQPSGTAGSTVAPWARVSIEILDDGQATLSTEVAAFGQKRYEANGLLFIQYFVPTGDAAAVAKMEYVADIFKKAFRKYNKRNGVYFYRPRSNPLPIEKNFERLNIIVEIEYGEIQ